MAKNKTENTTNKQWPQPEAAKNPSAKFPAVRPLKCPLRRWWGEKVRHEDYLYWLPSQRSVYDQDDPLRIMTHDCRAMRELSQFHLFFFLHHASVPLGSGCALKAMEAVQGKKGIAKEYLCHSLATQSAKLQKRLPWRNHHQRYSKLGHLYLS